MNYSVLSRQRTVLMGIAMLLVILFHVGGSNHESLWLCLSRCGNVGVDMFLFLSGIGLWFAWEKRNTETPGHKFLLSFYVRRYRRIYPAWLIIACLYYIPLYADGKLSMADTLLSITINWGFWEHDEGTFWFIPAIMMLYTLAPAYLTLIRRWPAWRRLPVPAMVLCVLIRYWPPLHQTVGHIEIFFSRIPIFLLGINAGPWVRDKRPLPPGATWMLLLTFAACAFVCINFEDGLRGLFPLFLERMVYIPLTVSMLLLLGRLFAAMPQWAARVPAFIGGISLELYLIHAQFILRPLRAYGLGYWLTFLATLAASIPLAWVLHKLTTALTSPTHPNNSPTTP